MRMKMPKLRFLFCIAAAGLAVFWGALNLDRVPPVLQAVSEWVAQRGVMAPVYFIAVYTLAAFLLLPILLMSTAGGFLFGVIPGALLVALAALISSALAYLAGRYFLRDWVRREIRKQRLLQIIDHVVNQAGWKIVILTRLAPIFPFIPLNLAYGVSKVRFPDFLLASLIGFLPGAFLFATLGSIAGTLIGVQTRTSLPGEKLLLGVAVTAAVLATVYMTKLTRKALADGLP